MNIDKIKMIKQTQTPTQKTSDLKKENKVFIERAEHYSDVEIRPFNLSEEICNDFGTEYLELQDVKEFIRLLKERLKEKLSPFTKDWKWIHKDIDALAGKKLIK